MTEKVIVKEGVTVPPGVVAAVATFDSAKKDFAPVPAETEFFEAGAICKQGWISMSELVGF